MKKKLTLIRSHSTGRKNQSLTEHVIEQYPHLKPYIDEWPELINSLTDTRRSNYLVGDGAAYINTALQFTPANAATFSLTLDAVHPFTPYIWNVHGTSDCCVGFSPSRHLAYGDGDTVMESHLASEYIGDDLRFELDMQRGSYTVSVASRHVTLPPVETIVDQRFTPVRPSRSTTLHLFRWNPGGTAFAASIRQVIISADGIRHVMVPYRRATGECGLLDITTLTFYGNAYTRGRFSILTK